MLRVVNDAPQVQVTWVSTYSGWMSFFMVFLSNCSGSPARMRRREPEPAHKCATGRQRAPIVAFPLRGPPGTRASVSGVSEREQCLDPRGELAGAERLGDVVVGAGPEAGLDVGLLGPRGQQDDRAGRPAPGRPG